MSGDKVKNEIKVHEHGFVRLLDIMGSDEEVENAARISYGKGTRKSSETRKLIRYLMNHKHTSPFEMCEVKFHLKLPIFVMRQLVRHRTANINEYSGRYSVMSDEFYFPQGDAIKHQSKRNKQGRAESEDGLEEQDLLGVDTGEIEFEMHRIFDGANIAYKNLIDWNVSRELARIVLPISNYTECIWKMDLNNFFHFIKLRIDEHAQKEIRDFANAMWELIVPIFPLCCEAFEDYELNSTTFSAKEMKVLHRLLKKASATSEMYSWHQYPQFIVVDKEIQLTLREREEFLEKVGMFDRVLHGWNALDSGGVERKIE